MPGYWAGGWRLDYNSDQLSKRPLFRVKMRTSAVVGSAGAKRPPWPPLAGARCIPAAGYRRGRRSLAENQRKHTAGEARSIVAPSGRWSKYIVVIHVRAERRGLDH